MDLLRHAFRWSHRALLHPQWLQSTRFSAAAVVATALGADELWPEKDAWSGIPIIDAPAWQANRCRLDGEHQAPRRSMERVRA